MAWPGGVYVLLGALLVTLCPVHGTSTLSMKQISRVDGSNVTLVGTEESEVPKDAIWFEGSKTLVVVADVYGVVPNPSSRLDGHITAMQNSYSDGAIIWFRENEDGSYSHNRTYQHNVNQGGTDSIQSATIINDSEFMWCGYVYGQSDVYMRGRTNVHTGELLFYEDMWSETQAAGVTENYSKCMVVQYVASLNAVFAAGATGYKFETMEESSANLTQMFIQKISVDTNQVVATFYVTPSSDDGADRLFDMKVDSSGTNIFFVGYTTGSLWAPNVEYEGHRDMAMGKVSTNFDGLEKRVATSSWLVTGYTVSLAATTCVYLGVSTGRSLTRSTSGGSYTEYPVRGSSSVFSSAFYQSSYNYRRSRMTGTAGADDVVSAIESRGSNLLSARMGDYASVVFASTSTLAIMKTWNVRKMERPAGAESTSVNPEFIASSLDSNYMLRSVGQVPYGADGELGFGRSDIILFRAQEDSQNAWSSTTYPHMSKYSEGFLLGTMERDQAYDTISADGDWVIMTGYNAEVLPNTIRGRASKSASTYTSYVARVNLQSTEILWNVAGSEDVTYAYGHIVRKVDNALFALSRLCTTSSCSGGDTLQIDVMHAETGANLTVVGSTKIDEGAGLLHNHIAGFEIINGKAYVCSTVQTGTNYVARSWANSITFGGTNDSPTVTFGAEWTIAHDFFSTSTRYFRECASMNGRYLLGAGRYFSSARGSSIVYEKYDTVTNQVVFQVREPIAGQAHAIRAHDGDVFVAGYTGGVIGSNVNSNGDGKDGFILRVDGNTGTKKWAYQGSSGDTLEDIIIDESSGTVVASGISGGTKNNMWISSVDISSGAVEFDFFVENQCEETLWLNQVHSIVKKDSYYAMIGTSCQDFEGGIKALGDHDSETHNDIAVRRVPIAPPGHYFSGGVIYPCAAGTYQKYGGRGSCNACASGYISANDQATECTPCPVGTAPNVNRTECVDCNAGQFAFSAASSECVDCVPGTYSSTVRSRTCSLCSRGFYQNEAGQTSCKRCTPGTFSEQRGSAVCTDCEAGTYENEFASSACKKCPVDSYQEKTGKRQCIRCPNGSKTLMDGSSVLALCRCDPGYFGDPLGYYATGYVNASTTSSGTKCKACPENTDCQSGSPYPSPVAGYFVSSADPETTYKCMPSSSCGDSADECKDGYTGTACETCAEGYFRAKSGCQSCLVSAMDSVGSHVFVGLAFVAGPLFLIVFFFCCANLRARLDKGDRSHGDRPLVVDLKDGILGVVGAIFLMIAILRKAKFNKVLQLIMKMVKYFQFLDAVMRVDVSWPAWLLILRALFGWVNLDFDELFAMPCFLGPSLYDYLDFLQLRLGFTLLITGISICISTILVVVGGVHRRLFASFSKSRPGTRDRTFPWKFAISFIAVVILFGNLFYMYLHLTSLELFYCYERTSGDYRMVYQPAIQCYVGGGRWAQTLPLAILGLIFFSFGIPLFLLIIPFLVAKYVIKNGYQHPDFLMVFSSYTRDMAPEYFWWEIVIVLLKFFIGLTTLLSMLGSHDQFAAMLLIMAIYCVLVIRIYPFDSPLDNMFEASITIAIIGTVMVALVVSGGTLSTPMFVFTDVLVVMMHLTAWLFLVLGTLDTFQVPLCVVILAQKYCPCLCKGKGDGNEEIEVENEDEEVVGVPVPVVKSMPSPIDDSTCDITEPFETEQHDMIQTTPEESPLPNLGPSRMLYNQLRNLSNLSSEPAEPEAGLPKVFTIGDEEMEPESEDYDSDGDEVPPMEKGESCTDMTASLLRPPSHSTEETQDSPRRNSIKPRHSLPAPNISNWSMEP